MEIVRNFNEFVSAKPSIVTIGTFDGVHVGHQKILEKLITKARENNLVATVLTFFPHPRMVLQQDENLKLITTLQEKTALLAKYGLDRLVVCPFDKQIASMNAEQYVKEILLKKFNAKMVIVGYDHRFGHHRSSDIYDLKKLGTEYKFEVIEISAQTVEEITISSTKIRNSLASGDITRTIKYQGHPFTLSGEVVSGENIGSKIGYPTANIKVEESYKMIPADGVYIVKSIIQGKEYYGMMNIGVRPTLQGNNRTIEVHLLDFEGNLYHQNIQVIFLNKIRNETKFESLDALKEQIDRDKKYTYQYIQNL